MTVLFLGLRLQTRPIRTNPGNPDDDFSAQALDQLNTHVLEHYCRNP